MKSSNNKKALEFFQKNYTWLIAVATVVGIIISNIFKFVEYITANVYFSYYGLNINLYKYDDRNFFYGLCLSLLFMLASYSLIYCIRQLYLDCKNKIFKFNRFISNFLVIAMSNIYIISISNIELTISNLSINFLVLVLFEFILSIIIFKVIPNENIKNDSKYYIITYFKLLPFLIIIFLVLVSIRANILLFYNKNYRIIDNNKVIVYSNNDYYLTLDCKIKKSSIVIYKGTQNKISNENVYSILMNYEKVQIK
ncbi:MAG: hypothetical protein ACM3O4_05355 [Ignavibacteriales bacterium]